MCLIKRPNPAPHVPSFMMFSGCNSTAHKMLSPNKQAHQQNKLSLHVRAIGETGSRKDQQCKQAFKKGQLLAGPFTVEVLHVIH